MSKRDKKYRGSIETEISFDDPAETVVSIESFTFQGVDVTLFHGILGRAVVGVDIPSTVYEDLSVFVEQGSDKISFAHQRGNFETTVQEIEQALLLTHAVRRIGKELIR